MARKKQSKAKKLEGKELVANLNKMFDETRKRLQTFSKEAAQLAKKGEKELVKTSKLGKIQVDLLSISLKKEKLYYELGKKTAKLLLEKKLESEELESYLKDLKKINSATRGKQRELTKVKKGS